MRKRSKVIYRQCPACGVVRAAAELKRAPGVGRFGAPVQSRCADCGHVALRSAFLQAAAPAELRPPGGGEPRRPGREWGRKP